jgi:hypothetical protein
MIQWLRRFFHRKGQGQGRHQESTVDYSGIPHRNFYGAGVLFSDGNHILAAEQLRKHNALSGFGGVRKGGENYFHNAYREFLEEGFAIMDKKIQEKIIGRIIKHVGVKRIRFEDGDPCYVNLIHDFRDLEAILRICHDFVGKCQYYESFPVTVGDFVLRRMRTTYANIGSLYLIPVRAHSMEMEFMMDMKYLSNHAHEFGYGSNHGIVANSSVNPLQHTHSIKDIAIHGEKNR